MKISRNDPCPCGSGKKYKKCCLKKIPQESRIPEKIFPEEVVVNSLLTSSKEFKTFYENERRKIIKPFYWELDSALPEGVVARNTMEIDTNTGKQTIFIRIPRIPPNLEDAFIIAHELEHLVLDAEGYVGVTYQDVKYESISAALSSMVIDLIVDSKIKVYGFNLLEEFNREVKASKRNLKDFANAPTKRLGQLHWTFNYVGKLLYWQLISGNETEKHEFHLWFEQRYPSIAEEAKNLLVLIKKNGYDTPYKVKMLFKEIIQRYNLGNIMIVC